MLVTSAPKAGVTAPWNLAPRFMHMKHLPINVVEAALARTRWIVENFDEVWVSFSGGKDSLACLCLMEMVYAEKGITKPINVRFMDEELVSDEVINFVYTIAESGRYNFRWYCLNMYVGFYVMGKHMPFVSWDKGREWHRKPPDRPYVIYDVGVDTKACNENTISKHIFTDPKKKTCSVLGIRADESLKRFLSVSRGGAGDTPSYVAQEDAGKWLFTGKPIYDWTELDIFKFFKDYGVKYCPCYDHQLWSKSPLRVASAMHERAMSQFFKLKTLAPRFYEQIRSLYPEIETHYRYYSDIGSDNTIAAYPHTFDGVCQYIDDHLDDSHKVEAKKVVRAFETFRLNKLATSPDIPLGYVSVLQVSRLVTSGRFAKTAPTHMNISQADIDYEADAEA